MSTCDLCLRTKAQRCHPVGELHPLPIPDAPWDTISVDFIGELPESSGYNAVMVVVDSVTKRAHFTSTLTSITAAGTAQLFIQHVWRHHGLPRGLCQIGARSSSQTSPRSSTDCWGSNWQPPQPTTPKGMTRLSMSTKSWSSICESLLISDKTIGPTSSLWLSSSTIITSTRRLNTSPSFLRLVDSPKWASNQTNNCPNWNRSTSLQTE